MECFIRTHGMELTTIDRMILKSYCGIIDGLAEYLGSGYEIVLHSLENPNQSVIHIVHGEYTGRKTGAPITDKALKMLDMIASFTMPETITANVISDETFAENVDGLIVTSLNSVREMVQNDMMILPSNKNKAIVKILYDRGIFNIKDSVIKVAELMGISKNTVYMHLRNIQNL